MDELTIGILCSVVGTILGVIAALNYSKKDTKEGNAMHYKIRIQNRLCS